MVALASLVVVAAAATPPRLAAPTLPVQTAQVIPLRVSTSGPDAILIDGCVPIELEWREGDVWRAVGTAGCDAPIVASVVARELNVSLPAPQPGSWRAVLAWGAGCTSGLPFHLAACGELGFVRSEPFEVVSADVEP